MYKSNSLNPSTSTNTATRSQLGSFKLIIYSCFLDEPVSKPPPFLHLWPCVCAGALSVSSFYIAHIYVTHPVDRPGFVTEEIMLKYKKRTVQPSYHSFFIAVFYAHKIQGWTGTGKKTKNKTLAVLAQMASSQSIEHQPTQPLCSSKQFPSSCWNDHFVLEKKKLKLILKYDIWQSNLCLKEVKNCHKKGKCE